MASGAPVFDDFTTTGVRWSGSGSVTSTLGGPGGVVAWSIAPAALLDLSGIFFSGSTVALASFLPFDFAAELRAAFAAWSAVADITFIQVEDGGGDIGGGTFPTIRIVGGFIDGQSGSNVLARAFFPHASAFGGDIVFDSSNTNFYANPASFRLTALHEIGHALGLNHENVALAIMNPVINTGLGGLQADDIAGIRAVYGSGPAGGPFVFSLAAAQVALTLVEGPALLRIVGNSLDNRIEGAGGDEFLSGRAGGDELFGNGGLDHLIGGAGADSLDGGAGIDFANYEDAAGPVVAKLPDPGGNLGDAAGDTYTSIEGLIGSAFDDVLGIAGGGGSIWALGGNDYLFGGAGNDDLHGQAGNDHLAGGAGADALDGGAGIDFANYSTAADPVLANLIDSSGNVGEAAGDQYGSIEGVIGSAFDDTASIGNDGGSIWALGGDDYLFGGAGNDDLHGQDSADVLFGSGGADLLDGGAGDDVFVFGRGSAHGDTVLDFAGNGAAAGDSLIFSGYGTAPEGATFTQVDATHWSINSADGQAQDVVTFTNAAAIHVSDYLFV